VNTVVFIQRWHGNVKGIIVLSGESEGINFIEGVFLKKKSRYKRAAFYMIEGSGRGRKCSHKKKDTGEDGAHFRSSRLLAVFFISSCFPRQILGSEYEFEIMTNDPQHRAQCESIIQVRRCARMFLGEGAYDQSLTI